VGILSKTLFVKSTAFVLLAMASRAPATTYDAVDLYSLTLPANYNGVFVDGSGYEWAAGGQYVGSSVFMGSNNHALLWTASGPTDLNPAGAAASVAFGTNGLQQVGYDSAPNTNITHAVLWNGTASATDLNPTLLPNINASIGIGTDTTNQVGWGSGAGTAGNAHALLWTGSASSAVDLQPALLSSFAQSQAYGVAGNSQVGVGILPSGADHALLWHATGASAVDLNPAGFDQSVAVGVNGLLQVGYGDNTGSNNLLLSHALLWQGTASAVTDLNPSQLIINASFAYSTNGSAEVGYGYSTTPGTNQDNRALVWTGSAASAIDLSTFLAPGFSDSHAYSIDATGNIFGRAIDSSGTVHAIEWIPVVPEPMTLGLVAFGGIELMARRHVAPRRKHRSVNRDV
jgi:hypothetical protein